MSKVGRPLGAKFPYKFTLERRQAILESISNRIPYVLAAQANGISEETFYSWLRQGYIDQEQGIESDYAVFSESVKKTEQEKIEKHLECIDSMPERWQAQAWILERRWWKLFSSAAPVIEFEKRLSRMEEEKLDAEINCSKEKEDSEE